MKQSSRGPSQELLVYPFRLKHTPIPASPTTSDPPPSNLKLCVSVPLWPKISRCSRCHQLIRRCDAVAQGFASIVDSPEMAIGRLRGRSSVAKAALQNLPDASLCLRDSWSASRRSIRVIHLHLRQLSGIAKLSGNSLVRFFIELYNNVCLCNICAVICPFTKKNMDWREFKRRSYEPNHEAASF